VLTQAPIHSSGELQRRVAEAGKTQQRQRTLGSGSARAGQQRCRTRRELARSAADAPRLALQYAQVQAAPGPIPTGFFSGSMTEAQLQCVTNCQNAQQQAQTDNQAFSVFPAWIRGTLVLVLTSALSILQSVRLEDLPGQLPRQLGAACSRAQPQPRCCCAARTHTARR
jgi:hypothetical protein